MSRACIFSVVLLLASGAALAMDGLVIDRNGEPVANATVSIVGHSGSVKTDRAGHFRWQPAPPLPFEVLIVTATGEYMLPTLIESLEPDGTVRVMALPVSNQDIVVTSGVSPNIEAPTASGVTTIARAQLESNQPARLVDAVATIPGVSQISEGHAAVPAVRGLARGRTLLLIDGGRVTTERRAGPSATYLDPFFLEGIEIARGPGSVAYGSDAFGGVIHAQTRRPDPAVPWRLRFQGTAGGGVPELGSALEFSHGFGTGAAIFQTSFRQFGDYDSARGKVDNSSARSRSFLGRFVHELGPGQISLGWETDQGRDIGRPRNNSDVTRFYYTEENSNRFTTSYELTPATGFSRIKLDFFAGSYQLVTRRDEIPTEEVNRVITDSDVMAKDFGVRALFVHPFQKARLDIGVDVNGRFGLQAIENRFEFDTDDEIERELTEIAIDDAARLDIGLYTTGEYLLTPRLTAAGGLRFDRVTTRNEGGRIQQSDTAENAFSGFGSLTFESHPGLAVTGQVARGFRDPTLSDRYFRGLTGRGFISGNPNLDPETSIQYDIAVRYRTQTTRWAGYFYSYDIDNLIERFEVSQDVFFFRNRDKARIYGWELESLIDFSRGWSLQSGVQWARGRSLDDDVPLDDIAPLTLTLQLRKAIGEDGFVQAQGSLFNRDERPGPTEITLPGYATIGISAGWSFSEQVQLRGTLANLFDKDFPASPDRRAVGAPGIHGVVTLELKID